jgi:hypothetical protein
MLGKSESQIIEKMKSITSAHLLMQRVGVDGNYFIQYIDDQYILMVYFFKDHKCCLYRIIYPNRYLPDIINQMNSDNIRVNDSTWTAKSLKYKVGLSTDVLIKNNFYLEFEPF